MSTSRWVKYTLVVFILIAVYNGNKSSIREYASKVSRGVKSLSNSGNKTLNSAEKTSIEHVEKPPLKVEPGNKDSVVSNFTADVINKVIENPKGRIIFEEVINRMVENYHGTLGEDIIHKEFITRDIKPGNGAEAECGDKVSISYTLQYSDSKKENLLVTKELYLGSDSLNKYLENGIIGMKENGNRKVVYVDSATASDNQQNKKRNFITGDVVLNKVTKLHKRIKTWGVFIDKESYSPIGPKVMCGDRILANYKIRDVSNGNIIYASEQNNKPILFEIGSHRTPYKITKGLLGTVKNKSRISIIGTPQKLYYHDRVGTKLIPEEINNKDLIVLEIDTKTQP